MPHYKNAREAKYGDLVVGRPYGGPLVQVGNLIDIQPGSGTCNAVLVRAIGCDMTCVTVSDFYHAEDAYALISASLVPFTVSTTQPPSSPIQIQPSSALDPNVVPVTTTAGNPAPCVCEATAAAE